MRYIDFFAGIGGFRRGLDLSGHRCVGFCENDKFATASYTSMHLINDEQRDSLSKLSLKQRQKEILKDEYRNKEWYRDDVRNIEPYDLPESDCWCFGFPCQDMSVAGGRAGLDGSRSGLVREIFRLLEGRKEQDRPEWIICENVKGMFSSNRGLDYLSIVAELDRFGYDLEWQNINSAWFVPQNRERIYTIGHLRRFGDAKLLPIEGSIGESRVSIIGHRDGYRRNTQIFSPDGITEALSTCQGGGREHHVVQFCDLCYTGKLTTTEIARPLKARYYKGVANHTAQDSGALIKIDDNNSGNHDPMYMELSNGVTVYAVWNEQFESYITVRRLTPKECFRLQGWTDDYFEKAQFVNSNTQLYKQAGNGVTVPVVEAIGRKIKAFEDKVI